MKPSVRVTLADGTVLESSMLWPRGTLAQPLTDADRQAKLRDCCDGFLAPQDLEAAAALLARVDALASVREFTRRLRFDAGSDAGERFAARHAAAAE